MSVDFLEPYIRRILSAPETDLSTISAKRVRRQLVEHPEHPAINEEYVKVNKEHIDRLIAVVYESVNESLTAGANGSETGKRKREDDDDGINGDEGENGYADYDVSSPPPHATKSSPKSKSKKSKKELTDEELARQLSEELNGRSSRASRSAGKTTTNGAKPKKAGRSPRKEKKSAAEVDSDLDGDEGPSSERRSTRKQAKRKPRGGGGGGGGGGKGGFQKEFMLSDTLASVVQADKLSRPQVVKQLWNYIKANDLQNPKDRREILCDDLLRAVFNVDKVDIFKMNKKLGQHLHEPEE